MKKELKELIEQSITSLEKMEEKIEGASKDFTEETGEFWNDLKSRFLKIKDKLKDTAVEFENKSELQAHLSMMEARDKAEKVKKSTEEFALKISKKAQHELDIAALRAHLAKMESEDIWEETQKRLSSKYQESKIEADKLTQKAVKEINEIFFKLTSIF
ncbi:MAG TPA: hypothetical protein CFH81_02035 [Sulfurovum sp. UBA12169]|nr:MAG TPA: hypothetical protein CFH81_02035 [Sulfurovum sp. UBA12169]